MATLVTLKMRKRSGHLRHLLSQYLAALEALRPYAIESIADYAEYLFEQALGGKRVGRGVKGHDVVVPGLGKVQVKERRLPADGRIEERLHLRNMTCDSCDQLGAIIFNNDLSVRKGLLVPQIDVWPVIVEHTDPEKKIRFDLIAALPSAVDLTLRLQRVQGG
jgi:hypothetical protein